MSKENFKVGDYVKFIDPAIDDYDVEDREDVLNRVYRIENINGDVYLLCADGIEVEALEHEMVKTSPMYFVDFDWYDVEEKKWHGDLGYEAGINDFMSDSIRDAIYGIMGDIDDDCLGLLDEDNEGEQIGMFSVVEGVYNYFLCEGWECPKCSEREGYVRYRVLACSREKAKELGLEADMYYPMKN